MPYKSRTESPSLISLFILSVGMYVRPVHGMNVYRTLFLLPDFFSDFFYEGYFGPLLLFCQQIAFFRGGKAALRAEAYLIDGQVGRGLTNPFDDSLPIFKLAGFG